MLQADVLNRGYSGYNTDWAVRLVGSVFPPGAPPPLLVTVFLGANDAVILGRSSQKQHVPIPRYKLNLTEIVRAIRALGDDTTRPVVVLIAPPPVDVEARLAFCKAQYPDFDGVPERANEVTGEYAAAVAAVGAELGCPVVPLWDAFQERIPVLAAPTLRNPSSSACGRPRRPTVSASLYALSCDHMLVQFANSDRGVPKTRHFWS